MFHFSSSAFVTGNHSSVAVGDAGAQRRAARRSWWRASFVFVPLAGAVVFAAAVTPSGAATQARRAAQPAPTVQAGGHGAPRYVMVDLGTFGGPTSLINASLGLYIGDCNCGAGLTPSLTEGGDITGGADTPNANPYPVSMQNPEACCDAFVNQTFEWRGNTLHNLGTLPNGFNSFAYALNASGAAVGVSDFGVIDPFGGYVEQHPVLWTRGGIVDLGTFGGTEGVAFSLNDAGQVVGFAQNSFPDPYGAFGYAGQSHAFLYRGGTLRDLGTLGTGNDAEAAFINNQGEVAGASNTNAVPNSTTGLPTQDPFLWYGGKMHDLGTLGGTYGFPNALSENGAVAGQMNVPGDSAHHPFLWQNGTLNDLGTLGGASGTALALNDTRTVVGKADISPSSSTIHHAFRWQAGKMHDLGVPPGSGLCLTAYSINSSGQIVGDTGDCHLGGGPSFLWEHGTIYNLASLVMPGSNLTLAGVRRINENGEISCQGTLANGDAHACMLVPLDLARREGLLNLRRHAAPQSTRSVRQRLVEPRRAGGPA